MAEPNALSWDDLRLVKTIAEARTLPAAAARLGVNHSTVFRRLKQIEEAIGAPLFEKHRAGYTLTAPGEEFAALAARVDDDVAALMRRLAGREIQPAGELRIATNDTLLIHLLTPLFARFRQQCRGIRLDILIGNQALNLAKRDADLAIRATDTPPETLVGRRAARIAWALYGRAGDGGGGEAGEGGDAPPPDKTCILERDWVTLGEQMGGFKMVKWVTAHIPPERIVYKLNTVLGLAEAVEAGIGIGYLPCFIGDVRPALARLGPVNPDFGADLWLLTHPDLRHSPRVRVFMDFLAGEIAKLRPFIEGAPLGAA
jgi:DNA-binding transcriptional LysR family regulator